MIFSVASCLKSQSGSVDPRCQWPPENKIAVTNFVCPGKKASKEQAGRDEVSIVAAPHADTDRSQFMFQSRYFGE
jgi:hypothetical protein